MTYTIHTLGPELDGFLTRYPEVSLDLSLSDRHVDLVEEGFDLAVRIGVLADSSLIARRLADSPMALAAAPSYLARSGRPTVPEDLGHHTCLLYSYHANPGLWRFRGAEGEESVRVKGRLSANNGDVLRTAALAGQGIVLLPDFIVGADLADGRLVRLLPDWECPGSSAVYAVYPASRHLSPKVRVLVDYLVERLGSGA